MTKGVVLFFEEGYPIWVQHVTYNGNTIRGWALDGHFWIDYNSDTQVLDVCISRMGVIDWAAPINTMRKQVVKCTITVPATLAATSPWEVVAWATIEKENNGRTN